MERREYVCVCVCGRVCDSMCMCVCVCEGEGEGEAEAESGGERQRERPMGMKWNGVGTDELAYSRAMSHVSIRHHGTSMAVTAECVCGGGGGGGGRGVTCGACLAVSARPLSPMTLAQVCCE